MTFRYNRYVMSQVTNATIRKGWRGFSDSFDPWLGSYENAYPNRISEDEVQTT